MSNIKLTNSVKIDNESLSVCIDPSNLLASHGKTTYNVYAWNEYTMPCDGIAVVVANYAPKVKVDDVLLMMDPRNGGGMGATLETWFPLKQGTTLSVYTYNEQKMDIYGLK